MKEQSTFLSRVAYLLIIIVLSGYLLRIGATLIVPVAFAILFAFLLMPIASFFERLLRNRIWGVVASLLFITFFFIGLLLLVSFQFVDIVQALPSLGQKIIQGLNNFFDLLDQYQLSPPSWSEWVQRNLSSLLQTPFSILATSLTTSTTVLASLTLTLLFTFFFLLYRKAFRNFILYQFAPELRPKAYEVMNDIRSLMQDYLRGVSIVMVVLAVLNSLGLWIIGINYPVFWGVLAALMSVVPYIGTTLGGTLPFLYALATAGNLWQPAAVVAFYFTLQQLEGNIITPRIVGSSVRVNPMVAIMSLLVFGMLWGVAGIILAIPIVAVMKVIMEQIDLLKPFSVLLSTDMYDDKGIFENKYNANRYRLLYYLFGSRLKRNTKVRRSLEDEEWDT